ncbi:DUF4169 family protein [Fulvimarina sp. 2208YS6-2-32]|uniref:DUF4169 family protein n=1 Tax=Fulvimarina uroteuthidis TaxID=3098149 RepID=A0ABU5I1G9_9HYPH|nr:DUF4169 family protein [Fulvimarina sp. 2208YS6-2-32]MDY8108608.1 DUF4169 family protein [Fulvimarina sp. 2208YS6-2-32]
MGDVVNLRRARKAKARSDREAAASENRARFGVPLVRKRLEGALDAQSVKSLDAHKREPRPGPAAGASEDGAAKP